MRPYWHNLFRRLQGDQDAGPPPGPVLRAGAAILARLYGLGAGLRRTLYARGLLRTKKLPAPVVSVGNLTVGGAGKTPVVACLARLWRDRGKRVAILSRGYGGQSRGVTCISDGQHTYTYKNPPEVGEEPYWLARTLPGVAVYTGACRYAAGVAAWEESPTGPLSAGRRLPAFSAVPGPGPGAAGRGLALRQRPAPAPGAVTRAPHGPGRGPEPHPDPVRPGAPPGAAYGYPRRLPGPHGVDRGHHSGGGHRLSRGAGRGRLRPCATGP